MPFPTASAGLLARAVLAATAKGVHALKPRLERQEPMASDERPALSVGVDGEPLAFAWQRFSAIILAIDARDPDLFQTEVLAVPRLTDSGKVRLMNYLLFCARHRVRELAGLHPTPEDLSALVAAHLEDYQKVLRDDGSEFLRVLTTIMPGPERMSADTALVYGSAALGVLLPKGKAARWLEDIRPAAWNWAVRAEENDLAKGAELFGGAPQPDE